MSDTHLDRYNDEFAFRWNHRKQTDGERTEALIKGVEGKHFQYKILIKKEKKKG